jgi:3-hydroxybutyrate dehydrogenase
MTERYAVVTGGGSGIGRATVLLLLEKGFRVFAFGRREEALQDTVLAAGECASRLCVVQADVRDKKSLDAAFLQIGRIDVLAVNAGVCRRTPLDDDTSDEVFDEVIDINLRGVWNTVRAANQYLVDGASVAAVSSGLGKLGRAGYGAYTASKHAVIGLVKCFALELAPRNIRVNAICPGWVATEMAEADLLYSANETGLSLTAVREQALTNIPLKRFVTAEETAKLIGWLLSDDASAITGQSYNISCGEFTL